MYIKSALFLSLLFLCLPSQAHARQIGNYKNYTAHISDSYTCSNSIEIEVHVPDANSFAQDRQNIERLLGHTRAVLSFECKDFEMLTVKGKHQNREVYRGHILKSTGWTLQDEDKKQVNNSTPKNSLGDRLRGRSYSRNGKTKTIDEKTIKQAESKLQKLQEDDKRQEMKRIVQGQKALEEDKKIKDQNSKIIRENDRKLKGAHKGQALEKITTLNGFTLPKIAINNPRTYHACENSLENNITGAVTEGDVERSCQCVDRAFTATVLTKKAKSEFTKLIRGKEYLLYNNIYEAGASANDQITTGSAISARSLWNKVSKCFPSIPTHEDLFSHNETALLKKKENTSAPVPGLPHPVYSDIGGLHSMAVETGWHALYYIETKLQLKKIINRNHQEPRAGVDKEIIEAPTLICRYTKNRDGRRSLAFAYWYKQKPAALTEAVKNDLKINHELKEHHPLFSIGEPRERCPEKQPDLPARTLSDRDVADIILFEKTLQPAAEGDSAAQLKLAEMYLEGKGTFKDEFLAAKWFLYLAEQGNAEAQFEIGEIYELSKGVPKNLTEAVKWFKKSANQNNTEAKNALIKIFGTDKIKLCKSLPASYKENDFGGVLHALETSCDYPFMRKDIAFMAKLSGSILTECGFPEDGASRLKIKILGESSSIMTVYGERIQGQQSNLLAYSAGNDAFKTIGCSERSKLIARGVVNYMGRNVRRK